MLPEVIGPFSYTHVFHVIAFASSDTYDSVAYKTSRGDMSDFTPRKKKVTSPTPRTNPSLSVPSSPNSVAYFVNSSKESSTLALPKMPSRTSPVSEKSKEYVAVHATPNSVASRGFSPSELSTVVLQNNESGIFVGSNESSPFLSPRSEPSGISNDIWLVEMRYRVLVAYQSSAWEKAKPSELIESMMNMELKRRTRLHELLLAFVPRQRRLFSGVTSSQTQILDEITRPKTHEEIKLDIEATVEKHADSLQHSSSRGNLLSKLPIMASGENAFEMDIEPLLPPLSSNLVCSSTIMERKRGWKGWKKALVVVTADSFLHLFDVPSSETTQSPEELFLELVPKHNFPTSERLTPQGKPRNRFQNVSPRKSFFLPKCTLRPNPDNGREMLCRVVGRFGQSKTQAILLRTGSAKETSEWFGSLQKESSPVAGNWVMVKVEEKNDPYLQLGVAFRKSL